MTAEVVMPQCCPIRRELHTALRLMVSLIPGSSLPDFISGYTLAGRSRKEGDFEGMPSSDRSFDAQFLVKYCSGNHPI